MEIRAVRGDIVQQTAGAIVVNLFQGVDHPGGATGAVDAALEGAISNLVAEGEIKGKKGEVTVLHALGKIVPKRVLVVGLGQQKEFNTEVIREVMAQACRSLRSLGVEKAATIAHGAGIGGLSPEASAWAMTEGALLGLYTFDALKSRKEETERELKELLIVETDGTKVAALQQGIDKGKIFAEATVLCRDMANEPANRMTPTRAAEIAQETARQHGLEITVLDRAQCEELGMGAFLSVAAGSAQPPKFVVLRYWGDRGNPTNNLGLLGKGITFDSGGISIKPAQGMEEMKTDMTGAAACIATVRALAQLKPRINVTAICPLTENMPGGTATKPGDVVRAMNGKTIEVVNTDAEGRLVLSDAICYAKQLGLRRLVDVATLTGAIVVSLGRVRMGLFTNSQELANQAIKAGEAAGERMWQLPLDEDYKEQIKSPVADIKNTGGRDAGSITAALFLQAFAEDTPWVHLDVAGVARGERDHAYYVKGSTGIPVRSLIRLALNLAEAQAA
ncbi:MAG: leucyl aminopeptidase [Chloroflexi bacterium]|nr:leucyl aminopeptidase [Chloroflexota bacterium]